MCSLNTTPKSYADIMLTEGKKKNSVADDAVDHEHCDTLHHIYRR